MLLYSSHFFLTSIRLYWYTSIRSIIVQIKEIPKTKKVERASWRCPIKAWRERREGHFLEENTAGKSLV